MTWTLHRSGSYTGDFAFAGKCLRSASTYKLSDKDIREIVVALRREVSRVFQTHGTYLDDVAILTNPTEHPGAVVYCVDSASVSQLKKLKSSGMKFSEVSALNYFQIFYEHLPQKLNKQPVCK